MRSFPGERGLLDSKPHGRTRGLSYKPVTASRPCEDRRRCGAAPPASHIVGLAPKTSRPRTREANIPARVPIGARRESDIQSPHPLRLWRKRRKESHADPDLRWAVHAEWCVARPHATGINEARKPKRVVPREPADRPSFLDPRDSSDRACDARCGVASHSTLPIAKPELEWHAFALTGGQFETANENV